MPNDKSRTDRRTRDQLRASNERLRAAVRRFVRVQEDILRVSFGPQTIDGEWWQAYCALKELMGSAAVPPNGEGYSTSRSATRSKTDFKAKR